MAPILFPDGPIPLATHDLFTVAGILAGLVLYYRALRRDRVLDQRIVFISLAAIVGGAIGARVITSWEIIDEVSTAGLPMTYVLTHGPRSIIGGLAGAYLAIGRVGCFLAELPLGTPTDLPWGMTVSAEAAAAFPRCPGCDGPMHPSMLYEIGFHAAAFALIATKGPLLPIRGDTLKAYLLAYGLFRFGVEFVRGNEVQALGLTGPQLVLIPLTALLIVHFVRRLRSGAYRLPAPTPAVVPGG